MVSTLPGPVNAAIGLATGALKLPVKVVVFPLTVLSHVGGRVATRVRGTAADLYGDVTERADELEDRLEELLSSTPVAEVYDRLEDALEDAGEQVKATVTRIGRPSLADELQVELALVPDPEPEPQDEPQPQDELQPQDEPAPVGTAASAADLAVVEQLAAASGVDTPPAHDDLPLPDYDHMTLGSLRGRLRSLSVDDLVRIRAYEKAHADRLPVVTMLDNRLARLATDATAAPAAGPADGSAAAKAPAKKAPAKKAARSKAPAATATEPAADATPTLPLS